MSGGAQAAWLPDGRRLHLQHGPIDLILDAEGPARDLALRAATRRFETVLEELVSELPELRRPICEDPSARGAVARRMIAATAPHADVFVTPMAAVAGAVADEVLSVMRCAGPLSKAYVNNGGDIAFHMAPGETFRVAGPAGEIRVGADRGVRGLATSGWRGRSRSLGIADAVTAAAKDAASADVAATMIANAVDLPGHPEVQRTPANELDPESDLGDRPVTVAVGPLSRKNVDIALKRGERRAEALMRRGCLEEAALTLCGLSISLPGDDPTRRTVEAQR